MRHPVASLSYAARRALVERVVPRYREASLAQKRVLLDTFVAVTWYSRKHTIFFQAFLKALKTRSRLRIWMWLSRRFGSLHEWRASNPDMQCPLWQTGGSFVSYFSAPRYPPACQSLLPVLVPYGGFLLLPFAPHRFFGMLGLLLILGSALFGEIVPTPGRKES